MIKINIKRKKNNNVTSGKTRLLFESFIQYLIIVMDYSSYRIISLPNLSYHIKPNRE